MTLNSDQFGGEHDWWNLPTGERFLRVRTARRRGGMTDGAAARDFLGEQSWEHGEHAYLNEDDAMRYLERTGRSEQDVSRSRLMRRRPNGARSRRRLSQGFYGQMEAERHDPNDPGPDVEPMEYDPRAPL